MFDCPCWGRRLESGYQAGFWRLPVSVRPGCVSALPGFFFDWTYYEYYTERFKSKSGLTADFFCHNMSA